MNKALSNLCPCHSGNSYKECCGVYHKGIPAPNAQALMRSRYAAYALLLTDYINQTALQKTDLKQIAAFGRTTEFVGLIIHDFVEQDNTAQVTFTAVLKQAGRDVSFTEKSQFQKQGDRWYYVSALMAPKS